MIRFLFAVAFLAVSVTTVSAQPAKPTLDSRWADLVNADEGTATRTILALAMTPKETTGFLKDNLKPVKADPKRVEQLIKNLQSTTFVTRTQAMAELEYLNKYIKSELEAAAKKTEDAETKMRIQQLVDKLPKEKKVEQPKPMPKGGGGRNVSIQTINGNVRVIIDGVVYDLNNLQPPAPPPLPPGPPTGWVRAVRAVHLLEHIGTPEAQQILQTMASGESDALPTVAAREALGRLKK